MVYIYIYLFIFLSHVCILYNIVTLKYAQFEICFSKFLHLSKCINYKSVLPHGECRQILQFNKIHQTADEARKRNSVAVNFDVMMRSVITMGLRTSWPILMNLMNAKLCNYLLNYFSFFQFVFVVRCCSIRIGLILEVILHVFRSSNKSFK